MLQKLTIGLLCAALAGCGGGGGTAQPAPPPAPIVTLTAPVTQVLAGGKAVTVSAAVSGGASVDWELAAGAPGSITASGTSAQYVPPASVAANTRIVLTAKAGSTSQSITLHLFPEPGAAGLYHIAGTLGEQALLDGIGVAARLSEISDAAQAQDGGLLLADQFDNIYKQFNALRKIGTDRTVSTLLRTAPGHADGDASQARLGSIFSVAQTEDGTIWFLDRFEGKSYLRRLANNRVSTLFDNGSLGIGRLYSAPGNMLYMTTASGTAVLKMAASADTPTLLAGADVVQGGPQLDGNGAAARFDSISDLAITPSGELVAADACTLRKITADGTVSTLAGAPLAGCTLVDGPVATARFGRIKSLAVAPTGDILVLEWVPGTEPRQVVRTLSAAGTVATVAALPPLAMQEGRWMQSYPLRVRVSGAGDVLLVREGEIGRLSGGQLQPYAGLEDDSGAEIDGVGAAARFMTPIQLSADWAGNIYVIDDRAGFDGYVTVHAGIRLRKIAPDGKVTTLINGTSERPAGIANGPDGTLYLVVQKPESRWPEPRGGAIYKVGADGTRTLLAGQALSDTIDATPVDGQGDAARFSEPWMEGVDGQGNIYVTDRGGKVRKITATGMVTTVAALPAELGRAPDGFRYKVDRVNSSVVRINADGSETVVAGGALVPGTVLGPLPGGLGAPRAVVPTGPYTFALASGGAILRLVLPH